MTELTQDEGVGDELSSEINHGEREEREQDECGSVVEGVDAQEHEQVSTEAYYGEAVCDGSVRR